MTLHDKLLAAIMEYDRKEATKRGYNSFALGIYIERLHDVDADIAAGANVREAIVAGFCGRLLTRLLKAAGEATDTREDQMSKGSWCYVPASQRHCEFCGEPSDYACCNRCS